MPPKALEMCDVQHSHCSFPVRPLQPQRGLLEGWRVSNTHLPGTCLPASLSLSQIYLFWKRERRGGGGAAAGSSEG